MNRYRTLGLLLLGGLAVSPDLADEPMFDLEREKVLYAVGYAHLDTQWRWDFVKTIDEYLEATLDDNFERFEQYPGYVFNFTGSVRYAMMKEYYPKRYEELKRHIAEGRWFVSGSSVDEGDVNVPSAEAVLRQVLYGNEYFRREFGKESIDYMLPDCFGFPASMPSIWAHAGLRGFSTQKLTWGSAVGIPFGIGVWEGPDGKGIIAALDPGAYVGAIEGRVDLNEKWVERIEKNGQKYGVWADYHYYGVGDMGGAPRAEDVANYLSSIDNPDSLIRVALVSSDQMYKDIDDEMAARLPRYKGDMLLTEHSAGTLTSQSYMKRWNRKGELLADSAERLAVAADWLGGRSYPLDKLNRGWERLLANQMHDILPGTSIPRAYTFSWNDEIVAQNLFAAVLTDSARAVASALDTRAAGLPLVVWNPLATAREDVVEAEVRFEGRAPTRVTVVDHEGREFPAQVVERSGKTALRAVFPLTVSNPVATYNWGLGTIERGNIEPKQYEVPSHEWFDLTSAEGSHGVSVLEDSKFGSDKPDDATLRLTLLYSPGVRNSYLDQHSQDWGRHEMLYGLYAHDGDWRDGRSEWQGRRLNQPLVAFQVEPHEGSLGRSFSLLAVSTPQVDVRALKRAERGGHYIVRLQELWGRDAAPVEVSLGEGIVEAWEVDGQERRIGDAVTKDGRLVAEFTPYAPKSFAVRLASPPVTLEPPRTARLTLPFDTDVASHDSNRGDGAFGEEGRTLPAEMLPRTLGVEGVPFDLAATDDGLRNAVSCSGEKIELPAGTWDRIELLAAATEDVAAAEFAVGETKHRIAVQSWTGFVGQWDDRIWDREFPEVDFKGAGQVVGFAPGYVKRDPIAWFATHRHHPEMGNEAYRFSYLFRYSLDLPAGATAMTLPDDPRILVVAATAVRGGGSAVRPTRPLYDDFDDRGPLKLRHVYPPPPKPVYEGVKPLGSVTVDREESFETLSMGPPVGDDAATGRVFRYHDKQGEWAPHWGSAPVDGTFPRLNDGFVAQNDDDTSATVWFDNEGRFTIDLGEPIEIDRVNTYSWHRLDRAPQWFSLWGSTADEMPDPEFSHESRRGWTLLAVVDTRDLGHAGIHGSSVTGPDGASLGEWRHLLWVAPNMGNGTFFTEIDVHARD